MPGTLVRSVILSGAAERIREAGRKPAAIAREADIPPAALRDPDILVSGRAVMRFFDIAARRCRRRNFGLEVSIGTRFAAVIGPLWILLRNTRTVGEMCRDLAQNYDLYSSAALMGFEPCAEGAALSWSPASGQADNEVQVAEFALATILGGVRLQSPADWTPEAIWFRHEAPRDLRMHRRVFGPNLRFNSDRNAILIDERLLHHPLKSVAPGNRRLVHDILRHEADVPLAAVSLQVEGLVRALLPFAPCSINDVAQAMGFSVRTLQKYLGASGESFRSIKDAVRRDLAGKYLQHSQMSATQIADLLGYADLTSFSRSFRRWNQQSVRMTRYPSKRS